MYLTLCSTRKVQSYIFRSSKLLENIGASYMVAQVLSTWMKEALPGVSNLQENGEIDETRSINNGLDAEVIYSGGGNSLIIFQDVDLSKKFAGKLSQLVIQRAPGLELQIVGHEFSISDDSLLDSIDKLHKKQNEGKQFITASTPMPTISVTAAGISSMNPAVESRTDGGKERLVDAETIAKYHAAMTQKGEPGPAEQWLKDKIPIDEKLYAYPRDLDHLGSEEGEFRYIAVIHADADDMGKRIMRLGEKFKGPDKNLELISTLRKFSRTLDEAASGALREGLKKLVKYLQSGENEKGKVRPSKTALKLTRDSGKTFLPIRPLIIGGDDITIVCDARIAHSFTKTFINAFERLSADLPDGEGSASMSAGIAIVKSHYPFARAYKLANELTRSAKHERKNKGAAAKKASYLDWAVMQSGLLRSLSAMRKHEYTTLEGSLCLRPVSLMQSVKSNDYRTWGYIESCVRKFQNEEWSSKRNKVKELRDSLREGKAAVRNFRSKYLNNTYLPEIEGAPSDFCESGWYANNCGYFDSLELMDFFVSICDEQERIN